MKTQVISTPKDFADLLAGLVAREEDVYLQIVGRNGSLIGIGLEGGKLTHLQCGAAEGRAVLPLLREIQSGTNVLTWPPRPNLTCSDVLDIDDIHEALGSHPGTIRSSNASPDEHAPAAVINGVSNDKLKETLSSLLRPYIGPMTDIICGEVVGKTSRSVSHSDALRMIESLAKNLRDAKTMNKFTLEARERISALF